jgi:hypothetical protein
MANMTEGYPRPHFTDPVVGEYLYAGWSVDPPGHAPVVRHSRRRSQFLDSCRALVREIGDVEAVSGATLFESVLIPPLEGVPRFDVTLLVRAETSEAIARVRALHAWGNTDPDLMMEAHNTRRIGDTELTRSATFLFNHFTADDPPEAVKAWESLAGWYTAKTGVDNSTLLEPSGGAGPYAFVNYVRLPHGAARFMLAQLARPSFRTYVRRILKTNGMVALPLLCKPV